MNHRQRLPGREDVPKELSGGTECGPRALWAALRYFGLERGADEIKRACHFMPRFTGPTYNEIHGTYLTSIALALREFGLEVEWSGDDLEPDPRSPVSVDLMRRAEDQGLRPAPGLTTEALLQRLDGTRVAVISHRYLADGPAHVTAAAERRGGFVIFPLEKHNPTVEQLETARRWPDLSREVVIAWAQGT